MISNETELIDNNCNFSTYLEKEINGISLELTYGDWRSKNGQHKSWTF